MRFKNLLLLCVLGFVISFSLCVKAEVIYPTDIKDMKKVTVMLTDKHQRTGGTGAVVKTTNSYSNILTNKHICKIFQKYRSGYAHTWKGKFAVEKYKMSENHDLCLLRVMTNLEVNASIATVDADTTDSVIVSGHPRLMPHMLAKGHMSDSMKIYMITGVSECTKKEWKRHAFFCWIFRGLPIIQRFDTKTISALITGGNSGSPVFSEDGEIVGVVFAGYGRGMSHGFIVPHSYVYNFLFKEFKKLKWQKVSKGFTIFRERRRKHINNNQSRHLKDIIGEDVIFPAIVDTNIDRVENAYQCAREGQDKCLNQ